MNEFARLEETHLSICFLLASRDNFKKSLPKLKGMWYASVCVLYRTSLNQSHRTEHVLKCFPIHCRILMLTIFSWPECNYTIAILCPSVQSDFSEPVGVRKLKFGTKEVYMNLTACVMIFRNSLFWAKNGKFTNQKYTFLVKITKYVRFRNRWVIGTWKWKSKMIMMSSNAF